MAVRKTEWLTNRWPLASSSTGCARIVRGAIADRADDGTRPLAQGAAAFSRAKHFAVVIGLFALQRQGTSLVGALFGPVAALLCSAKTRFRWA